MYDEHVDRQRNQTWEFAHTPGNFDHSAIIPPSYPSAFLTDGPEVENVGPKIHSDTSQELAEFRSTLWHERQEAVYPPESHGDPHSAITPPEGSYLRNSSSIDQGTDSSHHEQSISRQSSHAVAHANIPLTTFDGIEEAPAPSTSRRAGCSRKQSTHSSNSHHHSRGARSSQHSRQGAPVPQAQQVVDPPLHEHGSSTRQTRSRREPQHSEEEGENCLCKKCVVS